MTKLDYAFWFGLVSCISILVTWIVTAAKNRFNLSVSYPMATYGTRSNVLLYISYTNHSNNNSIVRFIDLIQGMIVVLFVSIPEKIMTRETHSGKQLISHIDTYSTVLPFTVFGHSSYSGFFLAHGPEATQIDFEKPVTIRIHVNKHRNLEMKNLLLKNTSTWMM